MPSKPTGQSSSADLVARAAANTAPEFFGVRPAAGKKAPPPKAVVSPTARDPRQGSTAGGGSTFQGGVYRPASGSASPSSANHPSPAVRQEPPAVGDGFVAGSLPRARAGLADSREGSRTGSVATTLGGQQQAFPPSSVSRGLFAGGTGAGSPGPNRFVSPNTRQRQQEQQERDAFEMLGVGRGGFAAAAAASSSPRGTGAGASSPHSHSAAAAATSSDASPSPGHHASRSAPTAGAATAAKYSPPVSARRSPAASVAASTYASPSRLSATSASRTLFAAQPEKKKGLYGLFWENSVAISADRGGYSKEEKEAFPRAFTDPATRVSLFFGALSGGGLVEQFKGFEGQYNLSASSNAGKDDEDDSQDLFSPVTEEFLRIVGDKPLVDDPIRNKQSEIDRDEIRRIMQEQLNESGFRRQFNEIERNTSQSEEKYKQFLDAFSLTINPNRRSKPEKEFPEKEFVVRRAIVAAIELERSRSISQDHFPLYITDTAVLMSYAIRILGYVELFYQDKSSNPGLEDKKATISRLLAQVGGDNRQALQDSAKQLAEEFAQAMEPEYINSLHANSPEKAQRDSLRIRMEAAKHAKSREEQLGRREIMSEAYEDIIAITSERMNELRKIEKALREKGKADAAKIVQLEAKALRLQQAAIAHAVQIDEKEKQIDALGKKLTDATEKLAAAEVKAAETVAEARSADEKSRAEAERLAADAKAEQGRLSEQITALQDQKSAAEAQAERARASVREANDGHDRAIAELSARYETAVSEAKKDKDELTRKLVAAESARGELEQNLAAAERTAAGQRESSGKVNEGQAAEIAELKRSLGEVNSERDSLKAAEAQAKKDVAQKQEDLDRVSKELAELRNSYTVSELMNREAVVRSAVAQEELAERSVLVGEFVADYKRISDAVHAAEIASERAAVARAGVEKSESEARAEVERSAAAEFGDVVAGHTKNLQRSLTTQAAAHKKASDQEKREQVALRESLLKETLMREESETRAAIKEQAFEGLFDLSQQKPNHAEDAKAREIKQLREQKQQLEEQNKQLQEDKSLLRSMVVTQTMAKKEAEVRKRIVEAEASARNQQLIQTLHEDLVSKYRSSVSSGKVGDELKGDLVGLLRAYAGGVHNILNDLKKGIGSGLFANRVRIGKLSIFAEDLSKRIAALESGPAYDKDLSYRRDGLVDKEVEYLDVFLSQVNSSRGVTGLDSGTNIVGLLDGWLQDCVSVPGASYNSGKVNGSLIDGVQAIYFNKDLAGFRAEDVKKIVEDFKSSKGEALDGGGVSDENRNDALVALVLYRMEPMLKLGLTGANAVSLDHVLLAVRSYKIFDREEGFPGVDDARWSDIFSGWNNLSLREKNYYVDNIHDIAGYVQDLSVYLGVFQCLDEEKSFYGGLDLASISDESVKMLEFLGKNRAVVLQDTINDVVLSAEKMIGDVVDVSVPEPDASGAKPGKSPSGTSTPGSNENEIKK